MHNEHTKMYMMELKVATLIMQYNSLTHAQWRVSVKLAITHMSGSARQTWAAKRRS